MRAHSSCAVESASVAGLGDVVCLCLDKSSDKILVTRTAGEEGNRNERKENTEEEQRIVCRAKNRFQHISSSPPVVSHHHRRPPHTYTHISSHNCFWADLLTLVSQVSSTQSNRGQPRREAVLLFNSVWRQCPSRHSTVAIAAVNQGKFKFAIFFRMTLIPLSFVDFFSQFLTCNQMGRAAKSRGMNK